jgi:hypothetical protein
MSVKQWVERLADLPNTASSTTNSTCPDLVSNPDRRGAKQATNYKPEGERERERETFSTVSPGGMTSPCTESEGLRKKSETNCLIYCQVPR